MGNRLSKIATRTGDKGETGLGDGTRVAKDSARIQALGDIDELNSSIGVLLAEKMPAPLREALLRIQHDLFDLGGEVCIPGHTMVTEAHVVRLDGLLKTHNQRLAPLKEFILPGGTRAAALAHLSRTACRRAERSLVVGSALRRRPANVVERRRCGARDRLRRRRGRRDRRSRVGSRGRRTSESRAGGGRL